MPLGPDRCNGPSGYRDNTIPPSSLKWDEGSIFEQVSYYIHVTVLLDDSFITHTLLFDLQYFSLLHSVNKLFTSSLVLCFLVFSDLHFGLYTLVWRHEYGLWYFCRYILLYSDGTCSVSGGVVSPPPGHAPPARKAVLPGVLCKHMCSCWSYITVCC
jgi:hypothetical protein